MLLVGGKARFGPAVPAAEPLPLTCGRDNPAIRGGVRGASRLPAGHGVQMVAAHSLLAGGFTAAGVWSSTTTLMIATQLPFNHPRPLCSCSHIALVLWPPGEPPVLRSAEGR